MLGARLTASVRNALGAAWNAPNEVIGKAYGYLGVGVGRVLHAWTPDRREPEIRRGPGQTEFIHNPFAAAGAITIGSNIVYGDDPYSPEGRRTWKAVEDREGHPVWEHERQHIVQARQLGPLYLPSNLLGGLNARLHGEDWHGPHNWNERGPQGNPPRPWAPLK